MSSAGPPHGPTSTALTWSTPTSTPIPRNPPPSISTDRAGPQPTRAAPRTPRAPARSRRVSLIRLMMSGFASPISAPISVHETGPASRADRSASPRPRPQPDTPSPHGPRRPPRAATTATEILTDRARHNPTLTVPDYATQLRGEVHGVPVRLPVEIPCRTPNNCAIIAGWGSGPGVFRATRTVRGDRGRREKLRPRRAGRLVRAIEHRARWWYRRDAWR
jgi:hypothetical protein